MVVAWRRKWVILVPTLAGLVAGLVVGHPRILRPIYRASATLLLDFPQPVTQELQGMMATSGTQEQLARLQTILQSNDFLVKVGQASGLKDDPAIQKWVRDGRERYPDMSAEELEDLRITQWLRESIRMTMGRPGQNIITIAVEDVYPDRARLTVQNITLAVIEANRSTQLDRVRSLHDFSREQLIIYKERLTEAEKKFEDFKRGVAVRTINSASDAASIGEVRRLRGTAQADLDRLQHERATLQATIEGRSPNTAATLRSLTTGQWSRLTAEIRDLETRYANQSFGPDGAGVQAGENAALMIAQRLQALDGQAMAMVSEPSRGIPPADRRDAADLLLAEARVSGARARLDAFDTVLGNLQASVAGTPQQETVLRRLTDEVETNRALYNAFVQQVASSQISEAFEATKASGRLAVLEPASRPLSPVKPNRLAILVLSSLLGLVSGIAALLLVERHDTTFRDGREAERALGIRVLGTLPQIEDRKRTGDRMIWTPSRLELFLRDSPAYQELRRIVFQMRNDEETIVRSLLITSSRGGEGKTTTAILLSAAAATEEPRTPTLLVDLDLRRGTLSRSLALPDDAPGVIQALEGNRIEESWFQKTSLPNLRVLALGGPPAPRNDLLTFEKLSWLLPELTRRYGFVVLDSPPNLPVPDPLIIGQLVDAVMMVIKAGNTPRHMVERAIEMQKQFTGNLRGILMNNVDATMPYYYGYRYYQYPTRVGKKRGETPGR
jgi:capsular exopolysaccharide synthesis family protein